MELGDGSKDENHSFVMFFIGELVEDIYLLVHKMLKVVSDFGVLRMVSIFQTDS